MGPALKSIHLQERMNIQSTQGPRLSLGDNKGSMWSTSQMQSPEVSQLAYQGSSLTRHACQPGTPKPQEACQN